MENLIAPVTRVEMRGIVKRFPGVLANDHVDFTVCAGEIHALLGENGAGKSTLMRCLYGMYQLDKGEILFDDRAVHMQSPADAIRQGVGMIHQHFMLVDTLTVAENVGLGLPSSRGIIKDLERVATRIDELGRTYGLRIDPWAYVRQLSVGQQQRVEIIKALYRNASLLILDEPTAVLTPHEVDELFSILRQMARDGHALIFISHKLHEVMAFTDRVTVLRDGRNVSTVSTAQTSKRQLAEMMVGREMYLNTSKPEVAAGKVRLRLENISADGLHGRRALQGVSFKIRAGEILGVAGISGNGQRELAETIVGLREISDGRVFVDEHDVSGLSCKEITERGVSYIPEERNRDGMIAEFTVAENLILREHGKTPFARLGFLQFRNIADASRDLVKSFSIKTPSLDTPIKNLSGGNIQKVILARELRRQPPVLIAAQPTRGLDIGATEFVRQRIMAQRQEGTATLLISEDLDEIMALSDRIAVMYEGRVMKIVKPAEVTVAQLGLMMAGVDYDEHEAQVQEAA
jgi:general nucleoside transport system ATP-binding protein